MTGDRVRLEELDDLAEYGDFDVYQCERCLPGAPARGELPGAYAAVPAMSAPMVDALRRCVDCLAHDEVTIDRSHVEAVHARFGADADPLPPWLAARAIAARPELAGAALLVADVDAALIHPIENFQQRLDTLVRAGAPEPLLDDARAKLAAAQRCDVRLEWERVYPWPAPDRFPGTVGFGVVASEMAAHALPALLDPGELAAILDAIDRTIPRLALDAETRAFRDRLAAEADHAEAAGDARRSGGLALAVRFLDELGMTGLLTNQDTLVDDCYFALLHHAPAGHAARTYRHWLEVAVPRALRGVTGA